MSLRRGHPAPRVGRAARAAAVSGALGGGILAGCGGTRGLILGEVPVTDAGAIGVADAAPGADDAGTDACPACPFPVAVSGATPTTQHGGTTGTAYADTCPPDQAVIGYQGYLTPPSVGLTLVGGIQTLCGALAVNGPPPAPLTTSAGAVLPMRGTSQVSPWTQTCPPDQVVVAFGGSAGIAVDQLAFTCAPWTATSAAAGATLTMGTPVPLGAAGGDGGTAYQDSCPPGEIALGSNLRAGEWVDAFGLLCGTPTLAGDAGP